MEEIKEQLELRMHFLVPYQLIGIQQGIQAGHAALEYANHYGKTKLFKDFIDNWKTWVILNGGTTNSGVDNPGSLNEAYTNIYDFNREYIDDKIKHSVFFEPDLNDALTAICFICDERVFNRKKWLSYTEWYDKNFSIYSNGEKLSENDLNFFEFIEKFKNSRGFDEWVSYIGGYQNVFLRCLIKDKKLA